MINTSVCIRMMYKARRVAVTLLAAALLLMTGCADSPSMLVIHTPPPRARETSAPPLSAGLRTGVVANPNARWHPFECRERDMIPYLKLMYESLVKLGDRFEPLPLLADRWERRGKTWTLVLRSDVRFHDGAPLTAKDVVDSFTAIRDLGGDSPYRQTIAPIDRMEVVDERTLTVTAKNSSILTLYALTFPVVSSASAQSELPQGTGPYWYVSYTQGAELRLEVNPIWWQLPSALKSITVRNYAGIQDALSDFELHLVDAIATRSAEAPRYRGRSDRVLLDYRTQQFECIVPNMRAGAKFRELDTRRAVIYAISRADLINNVYLGTVSEAETPIQPGSWLYEEQTSKYVSSPERALKLLNDAGWTDSDQNGVLDRAREGMLEELTVTLLTYDEPGNTSRSDAAQLIAQQLSRVGMKTRVSVKKRADVETALTSGAFDLALVAFNVDMTPNLGYFYGNKGGGNFSGYRSDEMESRLERVSAARDESELRLAASQVQVLATDELPLIGLFFRNGTLISRYPLLLPGSREDDVFRGIELWEP